MKKAIIRAKQQNIDWKKECKKWENQYIELQQKVNEQKQKIIEQGREIKELEVLVAGYYCDIYGGLQAYKDYKIAEDELEEYKQKYGQNTD